MPLIFPDDSTIDQYLRRIKAEGRSKLMAETVKTLLRRIHYLQLVNIAYSVNITFILCSSTLHGIKIIATASYVGVNNTADNGTM